MRQLDRNFRITAALIALNAVGETTAGGTATGEPSTTAVVVKLTRAEKQAKQVELLTKRLAADTLSLAELKNDIETASRLDSVGEGSAVVIRIGRADTSKEVAARIVGVKEDETSGARRYKATYGSGFDSDTVIIQPSQIISVIIEDTAPEVVATTPEYDSTVAVGADEYGRPVNAAGNVIGA